MALAEEVVEEYKTSLADLNFNSKPLINMLTMLAEDHEQHAPAIVKVIEDHIYKCKREKKLPALYLMDSIMKNLEKTSYRSLFSKNIAKTFTSVFEQVDEKTRSAMFKLRQTWSSVLPNAVLYKIDTTIKSLLDPAWPITAKEPEQTSIHVNPRFLQGSQSGGSSERSSPDISEEPEENEDLELQMRQELIAKQQELLSLKEARLKLELAEAEEKLKQQRMKQGKKPPATTELTTELPQTSSSDESDVPQHPRDPRKRPQDPRLRDPRLQNQALLSPSSVPSAVAPTSVVPSKTFSEIPVSSVAGMPVSSSSDPAFKSVVPSSPYTAIGIPSAIASVGYSAGCAPCDGPQGTGSGIPNPELQFSQPSIVNPQFVQNPEVFSGEVYEEEAKFSDENDSDSSRSSFVDQNSRMHQRPNIRDPRHRIDQMSDRRSSSKAVNVERSDRHSHQDRNTRSDEQTHSVHKNSPSYRDPRFSRERDSNQQKRNSNDKEISHPQRHAHEMAQNKLRSKSSEPQSRDRQSDRISHIASTERSGLTTLKEKESRSKSSDRSGRSISKERTESKPESKSKDEGGKRNRANERTKMDEKDRKKDIKKGDILKQRTSRDREVSPHKSPRDQKSSEKRVMEEKKGRKSVEKNTSKSEKIKEDTAVKVKKEASKSPGKTVEMKEKQKSKDMKEKSVKQEPMDIDERHRSLKEAEKRVAVDKVEPEQVAKKPKLEEPVIEREQLGNIDDLEEMQMDVDSESEQKAETEVSKINDDISDLFGDEDEDYRPLAPKTHLPLKSPSSKGWDQFKASQPEQYAYDIELKKQRQNSVVEERKPRPLDEPEDVDLRMSQPEFQQQQQLQMTGQQIPVPTLTLGGHSEILLQAHQKLKEGLITPEEHQDVLKNLGALMQLQEEQSRRLSEELASPDISASDSDLRAPGPIQQEPPEQPIPADLPTQDAVAKEMSTERPRDTFRIPKKTREGFLEEERRQELRNLYPESPVEDRYKAQGPFGAREGMHGCREMDQHPPRQEFDPHWREQGDRRLPPDDFKRRLSPEKGLQGPADVDDRFDGPPELRGQGRRSVPENRRGPHGDSDLRSPREFDGRSPRDVDIDQRGPRQSPRDVEIDQRVPRQSPRDVEIDQRVPRQSPRDVEMDQRGPPEVRESRGPHRGDRDRRPGNRNEEGPWSDRWGPEGSPDHRGGRHGGYGRGFGRSGRRGPEFEGGEEEEFGRDEPSRPVDEDWRDARRPDNWRESDEGRGPWRRGPPGRFRDERNEDEREVPDRQRGRGWRGPADRRGGGRGWRGRDRDVDRVPEDWQDSPQSWEEDGVRPGGPRGPRDESRSEPPPRRLPGPFGRPGPPGPEADEEIPRPYNSPKKDLWRDHPDRFPPNVRQPPDEDSRGSFDDRSRRFGPRHFPGREREHDKVKSLLDMEEVKPAGFRGKIGGPQGPRSGEPRGHRFEGHDGPQRHGPPFGNQIDSYIDKFGDPRFRCFAEMGPVVNEEVIIGKRNFEIKLGAPPRKIAWGKDFIEVFADPSKRGIVIDSNLMYRFGERVKDVTVRGQKVKLFYHGRPLSFWLDGQLYEIRVDAPPKQVNINGKVHRIQVDGRDMMILIDKEEKGRYGGEPRFIFIDDERMELRFDPPPRHILIDGNLCELKLNMQQPCVNINGILHGIRFDGPPRDIFVNGHLYKIFTDHAVKLRIGNRFHYVALGGPCHELIIDGRWFELKFGESPKEIIVGNDALMVQLPGVPPEVKILPEIRQEPGFMPPGMPGPVRPDGMPMPGPPGFMGPRGPGMPPLSQPGPNMPMPGPPIGSQPGPGMPIPVGPLMGGEPGSLGMQGPRPPMPGPALGSMQPPGPMHLQGGPMQPGPMGMPVSTAGNVPVSGPPMIPGIGPAQPQQGPTKPSGMPGILSSLFPSVPSGATAAPAPIDIKSLFAKLVDTGIIKNEPEKSESQEPTKPEVVKPPEYANAVVAQRKAEKKPEEKFEDIPDMTELNLGEMKCLPVGMIQRLYAGMQCTSCGQRFHLKDDEKTDQYRQHLDWHFRQNRKEKTDMKVTSCRKWYYGIDDWIQYEEVVDSKEKAKSFFEQQPAADVTPDKPQNQLSLVVPEGVSVVKCPPATGNDNEDMCSICHEVFEQYWDEDLEEWHLRDAIKVGSKTYHPICYEDFTDVSEGTPTPSAHNITEPPFTSRKALTYDEASQDGHHASFEEERRVSTTSPDPVTSPLIESSVVSSKSELTEYSLAGSSVKIKEEPKSPVLDQPELKSSVQVKQEPKSPVQVKSEPRSPVISGTDEVEAVKDFVSKEMEPETTFQTESVDDKSGIQMETQGSALECATSVQSSSDDAVKLDIPNETVMVKLEPEELTKQTTNSDFNSAMETEQSERTEEKMETDENSVLDSAIPTTDAQSGESRMTDESDKIANIKVQELSAEASSSAQLTPVKDETVSTPTQDDAPPTPTQDESTALSTPMRAESTARSTPTRDETTTQFSPKPDETTSEIHVDTSNDHLAPPEGDVHSQHSPTYSMLSRVKLLAPPEALDISPDVLEIGSNASTPTRDELPSPPAEYS